MHLGGVHQANKWTEKFNNGQILTAQFSILRSTLVSSYNDPALGCLLTSLLLNGPPWDRYSSIPSTPTQRFTTPVSDNPRPLASEGTRPIHSTCMQDTHTHKTKWAHTCVHACAHIHTMDNHLPLSQFYPDFKIISTLNIFLPRCSSLNFYYLSWGRE